MSKIEYGHGAPHSDQSTSSDLEKFIDSQIQMRARTLRPLPADQSFGAPQGSSLGEWFKVECTASGSFVATFSDGNAVEVTDAQLRSEQLFRHRLVLKLGKEFTPQNQPKWSFKLADAGVIEWAAEALEYKRRLEECLEVRAGGVRKDGRRVLPDRLNQSNRVSRGKKKRPSVGAHGRIRKRNI